MPAHPHTHSPTLQVLVIAWIQSTLTLRTYLAALPLPITIANPAEPGQLERIDTDLIRAHQVINDAPIDAELADQLRRATALLLGALKNIGEQMREEDQGSTLPGWEIEATHLMLRQANATLNSVGAKKQQG